MSTGWHCFLDGNRRNSDKGKFDNVNSRKYNEQDNTLRTNYTLSVSSNSLILLYKLPF